MSTEFVRRLPGHLTACGEAWLVVSDLPELLGLRDPDVLPGHARAAGPVVRGRLTAPATTRRERPGDPLAELRRRDTVALWRLGVDR